MKFKIHRGTHEIGGSCVEVWTENTRILLDFGMPLIDRNGQDFNFNNYKDSNSANLVSHGVLPDIEGLYDNSKNVIDGVIISHPHQDHYGLSNFVSNKVMCYLGEATHRIIKLNNLFTSQEIVFSNVTYFEKTVPFTIGDFKITAYWADHSAFDSYSFLIEADGKSVFYSGDFRNHGRKAKAFQWFLHNAPQNVDYLILEGTTLTRDTVKFKTETQIEEEMRLVFAEPQKINMVFSSGQNIDRLVSIYRACIRTNKTLVIDVYVASVLKEIAKFADLPYPSESYKNLKVIFPYFLSKRLANEGNEKILYQFKKYKITKTEISHNPDKYVMLVRPSMQVDLSKLENINGGNFIYSMWEGYLQKKDTAKFCDFFTDHNFTIHKIHTSGHADTDTLKQMADAIKPKNIIPIHTFKGSEYKNIFTYPVVEMMDGEIKVV